MFGVALFLYLMGFGTLLFDARMRENYSIGLALFAGILIAGAFVAFVSGMLSEKRLKDESHDSLP